MNKWIKKLKKNPIPILLKSENVAIQYWVNKDLLSEYDANLWKQIYDLKDVKSILRRQKPSGYWQYPGGGNQVIRSGSNYNLLETYRQLGFLVEKYNFTKKEEVIRKAASFIFKFQSKEGDFRGIYGNQYSPNYSAGIVELLIKAGYDKDCRIEKFFKWAVDIRQDDGGWAIPFRTHKGSSLGLIQKRKTLAPDKAKPFSHCITGVVLRAFAAHSKWRKSKVAKMASELLVSRFFKKDTYIDRSTPDFWEKIRFPFWYTDILSSLDSISLIEIKKDMLQIKEGLDWLIKKQSSSGHWKAGFKHAKSPGLDLWVTLAACRVLKRFNK